MYIHTERNEQISYKNMNISGGRNRLFVYMYAYIQRDRSVIYTHIEEYQGRMNGQIINT